ncbi:MAG: UMP kinase [Treponema sp.]
MVVLSVGGSIVSPGNPDVDFIVNFTNSIKKYLLQDEKRKVILTIGGGGVARSYIQAYKAIREGLSLENASYDADMIGIMATRLNAELIRATFAEFCLSPVVYDPTIVEDFKGRVLVAAGWKPGFSTDTDAVILASRFSSNMVVNLSNITKVYTADPKEDPLAKPIDSISWDDFIKMVGSEWVPGKNVPFDPVASAKAKEANIKVVCANGKDIANLENILNGKDFIGTVIG